MKGGVERGWVGAPGAPPVGRPPCQPVIHIPAELRRGGEIPLNGIGVEVGDRSAVWQPVGAALIAVLRPTTTEMDGVDYFTRVLSPGFQDVDLARGGPASIGACGRQHPERWPEALSHGQRRPHLEPASGLIELVLGGESGRGVGLATVGFPPRCDREESIGHPGVGGASRVILEFVVAPAVESVLGAGSELERPAAGVDTRAIELVVPRDNRIGGLGPSRITHPGCKPGYRCEGKSPDAGSLRGDLHSWAHPGFLWAVVARVMSLGRLLRPV